jgi:hypothetical protein
VETHNEKVSPEFVRKFRADLRALLLKNLEASPSFRRICRQALGLPPANSNQSKNLTKNDFNFRGPDAMPSNELKAPQSDALKPDAFKNVRSCQHIKVTGVPCGGPPMRGEQFCYFHQRMLRGVKIPPSSRIHPIAMIEDEESIQVSLMEIVNALARNSIDPQRAAIMVRALNIAVKNSRRAKFNVNNSEMVREVPDYPAPPKPAPTPPRAIEEEPWVIERRTKNAIAQLQSGSLATIPIRAIASTEVDKRIMKEGSGEAVAVGAPSLRSVQGWDPATRVAESIRTATAIVPAQTPLTTNVRPLDPTQRKPPARAGAPATTKIAVNQQKTRT